MDPRSANSQVPPSRSERGADGTMPVATDLSVAIGSLRLANPVMPASGCFGPQLATVIDLNQLGALVTKTIFLDRRAGNPAHRLDETFHGMLNSVGIPSPGLRGFLDSILPQYLMWSPPTIVSLGGLSVEEYWDLAEQLAEAPESAAIAAYELNVSCPNLEKSGLEIGAEPRAVEQVVRGVVDRVDVPVIAKLTPNVTSISDLAVAAEAGGAAAITVANTFVGMTIDPMTRTPVIGNVVGGVSGPAMKPLALRLAWAAARSVSIPVIGCGGVATGSDALEYLIAGSVAVQVGTATFTRADSMLRVLSELRGLLIEHGVRSVDEIVGTLREPGALSRGDEPTWGHPSAANTA